MSHKRMLGAITGWLIACSNVQAAELSVSDVCMAQSTTVNVIVSGDIANESTFGTTIIVELVPRAGATGTVQFTPEPTIDILQLDDPWPGLGSFSTYDTDLTSSPTVNATVDEDGTYVEGPVTFSGELASFPVVASTDAEGVWDIVLATSKGNSSWEGLPTTLIPGTITVYQVAASPSQPAGDAGYPKNRYISLILGNAGEQTALRVTLVNLPSPFTSFNGTTMWVAAAQETCENSSETTPPQGGCGPSGPGPLSFMASRLTCDPVYMDWGAVGLIYVYDDEIVPGATYTVQAIYQGCDTADETQYSAPMSILTSQNWGDVTGDCSGSPCTPPDGIVDIVDVSAIQDKFVNIIDLPKARADLDPDVPNRVVNTWDILRASDATGGASYPFDGPADCPPPGGGGRDPPPGGE